MEKLLVINPGSTSTKIAIFENEITVFENTIRHQNDDLQYDEYVSEQYPFRIKVVKEALDTAEIDLNELTAIVGRGGTIKPLEGGTYTINEDMLEDCRIGYGAQHASVMGALIGSEMAGELGIPCFVVDPPVVDEMSDIAKVTGLPNMRRKSKFHALNQKAVARKAADELGLKYEESNIIVAMMGGGVSVGIHEFGRVVDVNDCSDSEGPFSPERSGSVPIGDVINLCFSGGYTKLEMKKLMMGNGGVSAILGTSDMRDVEKQAKEGCEHSKLIYNAMAYQISKSITALGAVVKGRVDCIVLTGGIAYDKGFVKNITDRVSFLSKVLVYPGEAEMDALANGALRVLRGDEVAKEYNDETIITD